MAHEVSTDMMAELSRRMQRCDQFMAPLIERGVPFVSALVIAGDMESAERADVALRKGGDPMKLQNTVGSYARFEWCVKNLPRAQLLRMLPDLWVWSDPDDSDPAYLALWREAYTRNGRAPVTLGAPLPPGDVFTVYRGQIGEAAGLSWTLDRDVARKFSRTGGLRTVSSGGRVISRRVIRSKILAYLTDRNESEVIVDIGG